MSRVVKPSFPVRACLWWGGWLSWRRTLLEILMRLPLLICCLLAAPALAQESPPLQPYVPPPSASPLAPLPGDGAAADDQPTGEVRASSTEASNISAADTRSNIAPALPAPAAAGDSARDYLIAARAAIAGGRTGEAQEALERAESRALDRDVAPSAAGQPAEGPVIAAIGEARQALSVGNAPAALAAIGAALDGG